MIRFLVLLCCVVAFAGCGRFSSTPPPAPAPAPVDLGRSSAFLDWSNRIARPTSEFDPATPGHAWSVDEYSAIPRGLGWYVFASRPLFTPRGIVQGRELAGSGLLIAYVRILHVEHPDKDLSAWPWLEARRAVSGSPALDTAGGLSIRWRVAYSDAELEQVFHVDPRSFDPVAFADTVVAWARDRFPVDGLFLDYFADVPWNYPGDAPVAFASDPALLARWSAAQVELVLELRRRWPSVFLVGNGQRAAADPGLVDPGVLLDAVYWERSGGLWWTPERTLELLAAHADGLHFFDPRSGPRFSGWSTDTFAKTLALVRPSVVYVVGW